MEAEGMRTKAAQVGKGTRAGKAARTGRMEGSLRPVCGMEVLWRGQFGVRWGEASYVVEVDFLDFGERVRLYRDGLLAEERRSPARFELEGGAVIEAARALYGMKTARLDPPASAGSVGAPGAAVAPGVPDAIALVPLPGTAEARRLAFGRRHPLLGAALAAGAWAVLAVALVTQLPGIANQALMLAAHVNLAPSGLSVPAFDLPGWLNGVLSIAGILAGLDRGLRMKHNRLLDD